MVMRNPRFGQIGKPIDLTPFNRPPKVMPKKMRQNPITKRNLAIIERVAEGATLAAIGREFGLTRQRVWAICRRGNSSHMLSE
jgi:DNA-binding NarL/FixJ family response regulator